MIWEENFVGTELDPEYWNYDLGYFHTPEDPASWGWGNQELQHYTSKSENSAIIDGCLEIRAMPDVRTFPGGHTAHYSSARLTTRGKFSFTYGRIDVTAKFPAGAGLWPAIWLLPEEKAYGIWAASGEIDIAEVRGRLPDRVQGTIHFGGQWPKNRHITGEYLLPDSQTVASRFHTYSLIRRPEEMIWLINDDAYLRLTPEDWKGIDPNNKLAPFDRPFHLLLNLAIGGAYDEGRVPSPELLPAVMQVKSIRAEYLE